MKTLITYYLDRKGTELHYVKWLAVPDGEVKILGQIPGCIAIGFTLDSLNASFPFMSLVPVGLFAYMVVLPI